MKKIFLLLLLILPIYFHAQPKLIATLTNGGPKDGGAIVTTDLPGLGPGNTFHSTILTRTGRQEASLQETQAGYMVLLPLEGPITQEHFIAYGRTVPFVPSYTISTPR